MMTTFTTEDRIVVEKDGSLTANVEPIPFMGLVTLTDQEDREQMLRDQIYMLQAENRRLRKKLMEHGDND
jgi:hypothetical protein